MNDNLLDAIHLRSLPARISFPDIALGHDTKGVPIHRLIRLEISVPS